MVKQFVRLISADFYGKLFFHPFTIFFRVFIFSFQLAIDSTYCAEHGKQCKESLKEFKTVLSVCLSCKWKGYKPITARPYGP